MQNLRNKAKATTYMAFVVAMVPLTGCAPDAAAGQGRGEVGGRLASSYELVTMTKPAPLEKYFAIEKAGYDICVYAARFQKRSVKPFPALPADQVLNRTTYISDGRSFYKRTIATVVDTTEMRPETACLAKVYRRTDTQVMHDGKVQQSYAEADGKEVVGEAMEGVPEAPNEIRMRGYNLPKKVNQVALKCGPAPIMLGNTDRNYEGCVVDPALGVFTDGSGGPLVAYSHVLEAVRNVEVTVEPVSLSVGKRVDPRVFSLPAVK